MCKLMRDVIDHGLGGFSVLGHLHHELHDGPGPQVEGRPAVFRGCRRPRGGLVGDVVAGAVDSGDLAVSP